MLSQKIDVLDHIKEAVTNPKWPGQIGLQVHDHVLAVEPCMGFTLVAIAAMLQLLSHFFFHYLLDLLFIMRFWTMFWWQLLHSVISDVWFIAQIFTFHRLCIIHWQIDFHVA